MLTLFAGLTKLIRNAEHKVTTATRNAGDRARISANKAMADLKDTALSMRTEADDLEQRAKAGFTSEMKRIESVLEGI